MCFFMNPAEQLHSSSAGAVAELDEGMPFSEQPDGQEASPHMKDHLNCDEPVVFKLPPKVIGPGISSGPARELHVPRGIISAEEEFLRMLPKLLLEHDGEWIYVACNGTHEFRDGQDEAEIAALQAGFTPNQFVVRMITEFELPENW